MWIAVLGRVGRGYDSDSFRLMLDQQRMPSIVVWLDPDTGAGVTRWQPLPFGTWSHLCAVGDAGEGVLRLYVDGALAGQAAAESRPQATNDPFVLGSCLRPEGPCGGDHFVGRMDEVVLLRRALSPMEVRHYHASRADWGAALTGPTWPASTPGVDLSDAQPSLGDLRVTERGVPIDFEVLGARALADQAAALDEHVVAYWPLDGDATERSGRARDPAGDPVVGTFHGDWEPTLGRFGDEDGAIRFNGGSYLDTGFGLGVPADQSVTIEGWARADNEGPELREHILLGAHNQGYSPGHTIGLKCRSICGHGPAPDDPCVWAYLTGQPDPNNMTLLRPGSECHDGRWHHVALVQDGQSGTQSAYFDGRLYGTVRYHRRDVGADPSLYLGGHHGIGEDFDAPFRDGEAITVLDDVVIHDVARSDQYLRDRARPLPRVRFHVRTEPAPDARGRYRYLPYRLWWGDPARLPAATPQCGVIGPESGYIAWWRFDELPGGRVTDVTCRGLSGGTADGSPVSLASGPLGAAASFEAGATPLHLTVGDALAPPEGAPGYTLEVIARTDGADAVLLEQAWAGRRLAVSQVGGSFLCDVPHQVGFPGSERPAAADAWHHFACVLDPGAGLATAWLDHAADVQADLQAPLVFAGAADPLVLGADTAGARGLTGRIAELRVMSRPLTPAQMLHLELTLWRATPVLEPPCVDADGDGFDQCDPGPDCDDLDPLVFPGAAELCNDRDDDCDGETDEEEACVCGGTDCPDHPLGWPGRCNAQDHCEYAPPDDPLAAEIWVPPGAFTIGAPEGEADRRDVEWPTRDVQLVRGWFLGKYEVTVARYEACQSAGVCTAAEVSVPVDARAGLNTSGNGRADHPENGLQWDQADAFCAWLGGRLPSEAEWEYAATGPVHRRYPWGDAPEPTCEAPAVAVFNTNWVSSDTRGCGAGSTWPVDSRPAGASYVGALSMAGNVGEWVQDCDHVGVGHAGGPEDGSPWVEGCDSGGGNRVFRGACWWNAGHELRSAYRGFTGRVGQFDWIGVRCARDLP